MASERSEYGSARLISLCTFLSRILGVVRDSVSAAFFGAGYLWDAFSFAFRVPNLFRRLFGEGALSAAFIPVFAEYLERGDDEQTWQVAGAMGGLLTGVLLVLLVLSEALCAALLGWVPFSQKWELALTLTIILLPYSFLICMTAFVGGVLNTFKHFAAPALAPVVMNLCWILAAWLARPLFSSERAQVYFLAAGILVSGLLQLGLQAAALRLCGFRLQLRWQPGHEAVLRCLLKMAPIVFGLAVFQLNVLLDGVIAVGLSARPTGPAHMNLWGHMLRLPLVSGAQSVLYYADRLMQFPLGVFGIALATALFPTLSAHAARRDWSLYARSVRDAVGAVWFIGLPASVGLIVLAEPAVRLIFERGQFTPAMTERTALTVMAYSAGIWAYCGQQVLVRAFYAMQDTMTPVRTSLAVVGLNLALNLTLVWWMRESGIAAATAFCSALQVAALVWILRRRGRLALDRALADGLLATAAATLAMAPVCRVVARLLSVPEPGLGRKALVVAAAGAAGAAVFVLVSAVLRNRSLTLLLPRRVARRLGVKPHDEG